MRGALRPLPPYVFKAWYLVKLRDFTFTNTTMFQTEAVDPNEIYKYTEVRFHFHI